MSARVLRPADFIRQVRDRAPVTGDEVRAFVAGIVSGAVADYQATAFLMAVYLQGLADEATVALTLAMRDSGRVIDLSAVRGVKVDKHSTGGVGDKISLPLAPLVAACGVPVPMVSGRGLGHTGGTLDKLESIPGFRVDLELTRFRELVASLGCCLIGQTGDLAPADKKLYALRDVTATVESVPLITSSILSKKLAEGINALVLDVKVGQGAFMKDLASARRLAESLVRVGSGAGLKVVALLTRMEEPLGLTIGNALEVRESIDILRGTGPADTTELTLALGAEMLRLGGVAASDAEARQKLTAAIASGAGLDKLRRIVEAQHGDPRAIDEPARLPTARVRTSVRADRGGFVGSIDSLALGLAAMRLGAGRARAEDRVDPAVGLELRVRRGDPVRPGDELAVVHHQGSGESVVAEAGQAFGIVEAPPPAARMILERVAS
jgi:pyrimidine-nucleoside phosphorylase